MQFVLRVQREQWLSSFIAAAGRYRASRSQRPEAATPRTWQAARAVKLLDFADGVDRNHRDSHEKISACVRLIIQQ